jgi:hypothetical protein
VRTERRYEVKPRLAFVGLGCLPVAGGVPLSMAGLAALLTGDTIVGLVVLAIGAALIAIPLYYALLEPHEVCILTDGSVVFARPLLPGKHVPAGEISRIEWVTRKRAPTRRPRDVYEVIDAAYALYVYHSGGRIVLPRFTEERDFVHELERLHPSIEVGTTTTGEDRA